MNFGHGESVRCLRKADERFAGRLKTVQTFGKGYFAELFPFVAEYLTTFVTEECSIASSVEFTDRDQGDAHFRGVQDILETYASDGFAVWDGDHEITFTNGLEGVVIHCSDGLWYNRFVIDELVAVGGHVARCAGIEEFHALGGVEIFASKECMTESLRVRVLCVIDEIGSDLVCQFYKPVFVINLREPDTIWFLVFLSSLGSFLSAFAFAFAISSTFWALPGFITSFSPAILLRVAFLAAVCAEQVFLQLR